jgi:hypothetical protein
MKKLLLISEIIILILFTTIIPAKSQNSLNGIKNNKELSILGDTSVVRYFPLSVGNYWVFEKSTRVFSNWTITRVSSRIISSSVLNNKVYFLFEGEPLSGLFRYDTLSGNIYKCTSAECMVDSLWIPHSGIMYDHCYFAGAAPYECTSDGASVVLFGNINTSEKRYSNTGAHYGYIHAYAKNFGLYYNHIGEYTNEMNQTLKGCKINGNVYGDTTLTIAKKISENIPEKYYLSQNFPNPFNPVTHIDFDIPKQGFVSIKIYDVLGREVRNLVNEIKSIGSYSVDLEATDLTSGIYLYRLECNGNTETKRMIILK